MEKQFKPDPSKACTVENIHPQGELCESMKLDYDDVDKEEVFDYLDTLRDTEQINMFSASSCLQEEFNLSKIDSRVLLSEWFNK